MEQPERRVIHISHATFGRILLYAALVWLWLRIWQWVLVFVAAVFLAVALDPVVKWLGRHGVKRAFAAPLVVLLLTGLVGGFIYLSGASLLQEGRLLATRTEELRREIVQRIPPNLRDLLPTLSAEGQLSTQALTFGRALVNGVISLGIAFILTVYLLLDGRRTYEWLAAFVPERLRPPLERTADQARDAIIAYVRGNVITSVLTTIATWIALALLQVPAALFLAILAGVFDLLPVIGFILSSIPAVLLGLTVSPTVGLAVLGFYIAYNILENYYIAPKVYGRQLQISDLAVIVAFAVGAELGGVIGALIALPIAALYPVLEQYWMNRKVGAEVVREHRRIEQTEPH
jgi:predicted PurR-regulated permease PerM